MHPAAADSNAPGNTAMLDAALDYATRKLAIFPCEPYGKTPLTPHGCLDATTDGEQIRAWWKQWPTANIGLATGPINGLTAVDEDRNPAKGKVGAATMAALVAAHGPLPQTLTQRTWSDGRHYFFIEAGLKNSASVIGKDIDVRGASGYVVVPPSVIAEDGRIGAYTWLSEVPPAPMPEWLIALAQKDTNGTGPKRTDEEWAALLKNGAPSGERQSTLPEMVGKLYASTSPALARQMAHAWGAACQPPLTEREVDACCDRIEAKEAAKPKPATVDDPLLIAPATGADEYLWAVPEPPVAGLMGLADEYATLYSGWSGGNYAYWFFSYLTFFMAIVSPHVRVSSKQLSASRRPLRMYSTLVGPVWSGKSQAAGVTEQFFDGMDLPDHWRIWKEEGLNSDRGAMTSARANKQTCPTLLFADEFSVPLEKCGIEKSTLSETFNTLWERETFGGRTKELSTGTFTMHLSILGCTTPGKFTAYLQGLVAEGGLLSRLWIVPGAAPGAAGDLDSARVADLRHRTTLAIRRAMEGPKDVWLTPAAEMIYQIHGLAAAGRWPGYSEAEDWRTGSTARLLEGGYVVRLAAAFALLDGQTAVGLPAMVQALAWCRWQREVRSQLRIEEGDDQVARYQGRIRGYLASVFAKYPGQVVLDRDVQKAVHAERFRGGIETYHRITRALEQNQELELVRVPKLDRRTGHTYETKGWRTGREST